MKTSGPDSDAGNPLPAFCFVSAYQNAGLELYVTVSLSASSLTVLANRDAYCAVRFGLCVDVRLAPHFGLAASSPPLHPPPPVLNVLLQTSRSQLRFWQADSMWTWRDARVKL